MTHHMDGDGPSKKKKKDPVEVYTGVTLPPAGHNG